LLTAGGAGMGLYLLAKTVWLGGSISTSLLYVALCLFLSGLQLLAIGIVGEYLGKIMVESKQRPLYLLNRHYRAPLSHPILSLTRKEAMP
ncbi:MAG: glycosyl transferase, partial [uncultured bacterium]